MTGCVCEGPGFCARHGIKKTAHWYQLCQMRPDYFDAWEDGRGPGQVHSTPGARKAERVPVDVGLAARLMDLLPWIRERGLVGCHNCEDILRQMNRRGPEWSREACDELSLRLAREGAIRGVRETAEHCREAILAACEPDGESPTA